MKPAASRNGSMPSASDDEGRWALLVTRGPDAGACIALGDGEIEIGRSGGNDLVLSDVAVSRRHLQAWSDADGVHLKCLPDTSRIYVAGEEVHVAQLGPGEVAIVGDTALTVIADRRRAPETRSDESDVSDVRTLLGPGQLSGDVRGLSAIAQLADALDPTRTLEEVRIAFAEWARAHLGASEIAIEDVRSLEGDLSLLARNRGALVVVPRADGANVAVAVHGGALVITLRTIDVTTDMRRLIAVAARVCSSAIAHVGSLSARDEDVASLRRMALGSAKAFLGGTPAAMRVANLVPRIATSDATVLFNGESGTGKTFLARLVHEASTRKDGPLRVINCAAIPEHLVEAELFGHERGAFTGALSSRAGAFESAGRGTLLLDEIGELPLTSQAKLLRVLEERRFERVGSNKSLWLEARVLAATNRDLLRMVEEGTFRADLYYRISAVTVRLPALRERADDIVLLAEQLLRDLAESAGRRITGFTKQAITLLKAYAWPGNVRELRNALEHALVLGDGPLIDASDLPEVLRVPQEAPDMEDDDLVRLPARLDRLEERAIASALRAAAGNRTKAAALLGINRVTLYKKLRSDS